MTGSSMLLLIGAALHALRSWFHFKFWVMSDISVMIASRGRGHRGGTDYGDSLMLIN